MPMHRTNLLILRGRAAFRPKSTAAQLLLLFGGIRALGADRRNAPLSSTNNCHRSLAHDNAGDADRNIMTSRVAGRDATSAASAMSEDASSRRRRRRASAAFMGAAVGDAAAQTSHWNYDRGSFHDALHEAGRYEDPAFFVRNSFYAVPIGGMSCYGDQMMEVARHLARFDSNSVSGRAGREEDGGGGGSVGLSSDDGLAALVDRFEAAFGPSGPYGPWPIPPDLPRPELPIPGPWRHGSIKGFLDNLGEGERSVPRCGSNDSQFDAIARIVPVVCAFAGHPLLLRHCETAVRLTQNSDLAVAYARLAARVLEGCILGTEDGAVGAIRRALADEEGRTVAVEDDGMRSICQEVCDMLRLVLEVLDQDHPNFEEAVLAMGEHPIMKERLSSPMSLVG